MVLLTGHRTIAQVAPVAADAGRMATTQARQFVFTHFNSTRGLASNYVNNIIQDQKGYIWLATANGLQRYDGIKFSTYRADPGNPKSLRFQSP